MTKRGFLSICILFVLAPYWVFAQKEAVFNPGIFLQRIQQMKDDTNKINAYIDRPWLSNFQHMEEFYAPMIALSQKLNWPKGIIKIDFLLADYNNRINTAEGGQAMNHAYRLAVKYGYKQLQYKALLKLADIDAKKGRYNAAKSKLDSCINYFEKTGATDDLGYAGFNYLEFFRWYGHSSILEKQAVTLWQNKLTQYSSRHNKAYTLAALEALSQYYSNKSDYVNELRYQQQWLAFFQPNDTSAVHGNLLYNIGDTYQMMGNYAKTLEYYKKLSLLKTHSIAGDPFDLPVEMSIADIYSTLEDYPSAIKYRFTALKKTEQDNNIGAAIHAINAIAGDYISVKQYDNALSYLNYGLKLSNQLGNTNQKARILCSMVWVNYLLKNYGTALKLSHEQLKIDTFSFSFPLRQTNFYLGSIYRDAPDDVLKADGIDPAQRYRLSIKKLTDGLAIFKSQYNVIGLQRDAYQQLNLTYFKQGDYKKAYEAFNNYLLLRDSLTGQNKQKQFRALESQYAFKAEKDSLNVRQQITAQQLHTKQVQSYYLIAGISLLVALSFFVYRNYKKANFEKRRSDGLLLNILPADVAEELKEKGSANARLFDEVTVLFTDFVNFTAVSETLSPQQLVDELNVCFKAFDNIMTTHNIEKIKTIGDAYLAVSGLPHAHKNHAFNTIKAAHEIQQFMLDRKQQMGDRSFGIRIGIHSGSVVAGIVGVKKFAYDIWGDTVNTAARMEQNSEAGKINVSEKTFELVKDQFTFTYRGEIEAKNKGAMKMYFVG